MEPNKDRNNSRLISQPAADDQQRRLEEELTEAMGDLRRAEAELAEEQAAVNAFRMHCRLVLGEWVDEVLALRAEKQRLLTKLSLLEQAVEDGQPLDPDRFWDDEAPLPPEDAPPFEDSYEPPIPVLVNDRRAEKRLYRELARRFHPDLAENGLQRAYATSLMATVNEAYARHDLEALRDLAGEVDVNTAVGLQTNPALGKAFRRSQRRLRKCRQRRRKIALQLRTLRAEKIARLWRKAQSIPKSDGSNWWDEVVETLQADIAQSAGEIDQLNQELESLLARVHPLPTPPDPDLNE